MSSSASAPLDSASFQLLLNYHHQSSKWTPSSSLPALSHDPYSRLTLALFNLWDEMKEHLGFSDMDEPLLQVNIAILQGGQDVAACLLPHAVSFCLYSFYLS